jgi:hypothetical protein
VLGPAVLRELLLESGDFRSEDVAAAIDHPFERGHQFMLEDRFFFSKRVYMEQ